MIPKAGFKNLKEHEDYILSNRKKKKPQIQWTTDPPTVEGFYWIIEFCGPTIAEVHWNESIGEFRFHKFGSDYSFDMGEIAKRSTEPMEVPE